MEQATTTTVEPVSDENALALAIGTSPSIPVKVDSPEALYAQLDRETRQQAKVLANTLGWEDDSSILIFGASVQQGLNAATQPLLSETRNSQAGLVGGLLRDFVVESRKFDPSKLAAKAADQAKGPSFVSKLFGRAKDAVDEIDGEVRKALAQYDTIEASLKKIADQMKENDRTLERSNQTLDRLVVADIEAYKLLILHIAAGWMKLQEWKPQRDEMAKVADDPLVINELQRLTNAINLLETRLFSLFTLRVDAEQGFIQIGVMKSTNNLLRAKIGDAVSLGLPRYQRGMAIAVNLHDQGRTAVYLDEFDDALNATIEANARMLRQTATTAAKLAVQPTIRPETLINVHKEMMGMFDDFAAIEAKAITDREASYKALGEIVSEERQKVRESSAVAQIAARATTR